MVRTIHQSLDANEAPPVWPAIIPARRRDQLSPRAGLRKRLNAYSAAAGALNKRTRGRILDCLSEQNEIAKLVGGQVQCDTINDLPEQIRGPISELFIFAFRLLTSLGIRDRHYRAIYRTLSYKVCPFCGSEYFDAPGAPREDLDHYLASSLYPFAATNLRNLSPMGIKCNARYKLAADILRDENGRRRRSFDPYANRKIKVSLMRSVPFGAPNNRTPAWQIDLIPDSVECKTWDEVFKLRERLQRDVLNDCFLRWLREFAEWFMVQHGAADLSDRKVSASIREHARNMALQGFCAKEFLRTHVFEMIYFHCRNDNRRMLDFVRDLITHATLQ